jgi:hypothetical protein
LNLCSFGGCKCDLNISIVWFSAAPDRLAGSVLPGQKPPSYSGWRKNLRLQAKPRNTVQPLLLTKFHSLEPKDTHDLTRCGIIPFIK